MGGKKKKIEEEDDLLASLPESLYSSQHHVVSPNEASQRCCTVEHKTNLLPMLIRNAGPESPVERAQAVHKIRHLKDHLCQKAVLCIRTTAVARDTRNNAHTTGAILHQYHGTSAQFILQIALWCCAVLGLQLYSAMIHATVSSLLLDSGLSAPIH